MVFAEKTDVLVVGAGPVGLLVALGLAQQEIDTVIIEKRSLISQEKAGRACSLYPRTMELLDILGVVPEMLQNAFTGSTYAVYSKGRRVARKAWQNMAPMMDASFHNYVTNIRQNNSQRVFAAKYKVDHGRVVNYEWELVSQKIDTTVGDGYNVTAELVHSKLGKRTVRSKYIVGADGGQSAVRTLAGLEMQGDDTTYKWVRLDGKFKTDIPEPNVVFAALENDQHKVVLWAKLDHDAHRIGFAMDAALQEKYPNGPTEQQVQEEAAKAVAPFKLQIERLDWWTYYQVKQKVVESLQKDQYILLAGDAAHVHSSAYAQGMNTGVHDATNLTWKLAGVLKRWYRPEVLATYSEERRAAAQQVIHWDKLAAQAASGAATGKQIIAGVSPQDTFRSIFEAALGFTIGLGVSYDPSVISQMPVASTLFPGMRSPDATLYAPGPALPIRLHSLTHAGNQGRWSLLVFAGHTHLTKDVYKSLRLRLTGPDNFMSTIAERVTPSTIIVGKSSCAWDTFDGPAIGRYYFDVDGTAHARYGIYEDNGGLVLIRPDGVFGYGAELGQAAEIEAFLSNIFV